MKDEHIKELARMRNEIEEKFKMSEGREVV